MRAQPQTPSAKFSSERSVYNLCGFFCLIMIFLLGLSASMPGGMLMSAIGLFWHIVGIVIFFVIGLFSVMCIIHVNSLDRHPSLGRVQPDFHSLRQVDPRAYKAKAANSTSGVRRIVNIN
jgi:hypothetical protein